MKLSRRRGIQAEWRSLLGEVDSNAGRFIGVPGSAWKAASFPAPSEWTGGLQFLVETSHPQDLAQAEAGSDLGGIEGMARRVETAGNRDDPPLLTLLDKSERHGSMQRG